jgi:protein O-mannosyl-transferase
MKIWNQSSLRENRQATMPTQTEILAEESADSARPQASAARSGLFSSSRESSLLAGLSLALGTLLVYQRSLHNGFVNYDDPGFVTDNPFVRQGLSWHTLAWAFRTTSQDYWHPLAWISHMLDIQLFGLNPTGHHLDSLFLHILNVVLFFWILRRATGYVARSAVAAGLFALLPLNVESVAWVAERKTLLCTTFLLFALCAYGWYVKKPGVGRYLSVFFLFALGLMAKPMLVTFPFALLLVDFWPLNRIDLPKANGQAMSEFRATLLKLVVEKIPLLILSGASAAFTFIGVRRLNGIVSVDYFPMSWRIKNVLWSYLLYIFKGLWPSRLAAFYPFAGGTIGMAQAAGSAIVLIGITALVWRFREKRYLPAGWLWYLGTLVPVIGILQAGHQAMADRYAYFSFWGLFACVVWAVADAAPRIGLNKPVLAVIAAAALIAYATVSFIQIGYWHDSYALFTHALQVTDKNPIAENDLGAALVDMGQSDLATPHFQAAVEYMPDYATAHYNLGLMLQKQNRLDDAANEYRSALIYTRDPVEASHVFNNLAVLREQQNEPAEALRAYDAALKIDPYDIPSRIGRGMLEYRRASLDAAQVDLSWAVRLDPNNATTCYWLGRVLEDKGNIPLAESAYETALTLSPDLADAKAHLDALRRGHQQ